MSQSTITNFKWGEVHTSTGRKYKDCLIGPFIERNWDWSDDGTRHKPGITMNALSPLLKCRVIILSTGMDEQLHVSDEARQYLNKHRIMYYILQSNKAVDLYNGLVKQHVPVGILLHSTC